MQELRLRPYHDLEGAIFRPEAGWLIPATYGPVDAEVRAVRTRAGMIDWSDRAKIRLTGSERVTFLDGIVTADMKILTPGMSAYALLLNEKSRVLGDLRVYAFADSLVLDIEASQKDTIMAILEKARVSDDVEFHDLGACGHIEVHGPASGDLLTGVLPVDARGLPQDAFLTFAVDKHHEGDVGRVRRKLFGLRVDADVPPVHGDKVSKGTREVGKVTSGTWSPTTGWVIAIALLRAEEVSAKDTLFIDRGGWDLRAQLHPLPFVRGSA